MFTKQIEDKKNYIHQLEQTSRDNESSTQNDQKTLETKLFNLKQKLENEREKLKNIDKILSMKIAPVTESNNNSAFDDDKSFNNSIVAATTTTSSSSDIMSKSFNENMFFNRSKIEVSYFDFSMTTESLPRNSKIAPNSTSSPERKQILSATTTKRVVTESDNNNSPLMMPKYHSLSSINYVNDNNNSQKKIIVPIMNGNVKNERPSPSTSSSSSTSRNAVQLRNLPKQKRPLTQFLPNFQLDFNLRNHIETAGHQIQLCPHVIIDGKSFVIFFNHISFIHCFFGANFSDKLPRLSKQSRFKAIIFEFTSQYTMVCV